MILFTIIFLLIAIILPFFDFLWEKRMEKHPENRNKMKIYGVIISIQWTMALLILGLYYVKDLSFSELGFISKFGELSSFLGFIAGLLVSTIIVTLALIVNPITRKKY